jgi:organic radical activating enzyme
MNIFERIKENLFPTISPLPAGIYHYQTPLEDEENIRYHLRLEEDASGLLIINASTVLHLNQTAAEFAYYLIQQESDEEITAKVAKRYRAPKEQVGTDLNQFKEQIDALIHMTDLDPVTFFGLDRVNPYSKDISAPYRMDIALTYQSNSEESAKVAPTDRVKRELSTEEWKLALDKLWEAGIPHVNFTGGEPTVRPDIIDLIEYAEKLGLVSGLLTDGTRLTEPKLLKQLLESGLDHIMILFDPKSDQAWEAVRDALAEDIFVTVHLTLTENNQESVQEAIEKLAEMQVPSISISATTIHLKSTLEQIQQQIAEKQITLIWDIPVPYSSFNPVALEIENGDMPVAGAGKAWLYVEPDGDVLEAQGIPDVWGNLISDKWSDIWNFKK